MFPYVVAHREMSCFCSFCVHPRPDSSCDNAEFCGPWEVSELKKKHRGDGTVEAAAAVGGNAAIAEDVVANVQRDAGDGHVEG